MYAMVYKMYALFADAENVPPELIKQQSNTQATVKVLEDTLDDYFNKPPSDRGQGAMKYHACRLHILLLKNDPRTHLILEFYEQVSTASNSHRYAYALQ